LDIPAGAVDAAERAIAAKLPSNIRLISRELAQAAVYAALFYLEPSEETVRRWRRDDWPE